MTTSTAPMTKAAKQARRSYLLRLRGDYASVVFSLPQGSPERRDTEAKLASIAAELKDLKA